MVERGEIEAIVMTASGCGTFVKEYGTIFKEDPAYREKAERISALTRDLSEVVPETAMNWKPAIRRVAFQSPCSLQHGQQIRGKVEALLRAAGYELTPVADGHLCCGSAGTYSILQPELSGQLRDAQARRAGCGRRRTHRHRQYRLPDAPAGRHAHSGEALDRTAGVDFPRWKPSSAPPARTTAPTPARCW